MELPFLLSDFVIPIFALIAFLLVAFCIGARILALLKLELGKLEEFLTSVALGAGFLIWFAIFLGTFHLLYKEAYILLAVAVTALSARQVRQFWLSIMLLGRNIKQSLKPNAPRLLRLLLLAYVFFILINWLTAFSPITESDSLSYHLAFAKAYANSHQLAYQPSHIYTAMPQGMTLLYTISELFSTPGLSSLIAYSFGVFASLAIYAIAKRYFSETAALIASLLFFTSPAVIERLRQTMVDISVTYFFLLSVIVLLKYADEYNERKRTALAVLLSILIGTAISVKLTGVFAAGALFIGIVLSWLLYRRKSTTQPPQAVGYDNRWVVGSSMGNPIAPEGRGKHPLKKFNANNAKHALIFGFITLLFISPWLARGYFYTGNPVYPQAYSLLGGKYLDSSLTQFYASQHKAVGLERNVPNTLLVHWNITFKSRAFDSPVGLTPFFLMALPLALFFYREIRDMRKWAIIFAMSAVILAAQFWVHPVIRYMFPGIALLSISTAAIMGAMIRHKLLKAAVILLLMASLVFNAAMWYGLNAKNIHYFASGESKGEYYATLKNYNLYGAVTWLNANTTGDSAVMLFNDQRGYFLDRRYIISSPYQTYIDYGSMNNATGLLKRLEELDVDYVLINDRPSRFNTYSYSAAGEKHANELVESLVKEHGQLMYDENHVRVYKISAAA